jgi:hypothetical protein
LVSDNPGGTHISAGPSLDLGGGKQRKIKQLKLGSISNTVDGQGLLLAIGLPMREEFGNQTEEWREIIYIFII